MERTRQSRRNRWSTWGGVVALAGALAMPAIPAAAAPATTAVSIEVLSNRADLVSGGDALVEVRAGGADLGEVRVSLDGADVSDAFAVRADGRLVGLVDTLEPGDNVLVAEVGESSARITITDHSRSGPVISGIPLQPWLCTTEANGLGPATDDACNAPTQVEWYYRSTAGPQLQPYDPADPPTDVATTTTDEGEAVPFVVRRERGTMNRGIYDVAVLFDPAEPWEPWAPQPAWNGKVVWPFGPSSGTLHSQGSPRSVLNATRLGAGFMLATSSLNVHGSNVNTVVSAESVMMLQEHIVESYGEIRYVIGAGGSGGAIGQQMVANTYPGLIDGLIPAMSYPDTWTTGLEVTDCSALVETIERLGGNEAWSAEKRTAIYGHATPITCSLFPRLFGAGADPTVGCGLPADVTFHPETNPDGVRCTTPDYMVNVWGLDPDTGHARIAGSTIGIQWGLDAFERGIISAEEFVSLNEEFGSLDEEPGVRRPSDHWATAMAYRTGQVNDGSNLDSVPIIDVRRDGNNEFHTNYHTWALRDRLVKSNGHADNHVVFWSDGGIPATVGEEVFQAMDHWLAAIEADTTGDPLEDKVVRNRPTGLVDTCFVGGERSTDYEQCLEQVPYYGAPRTAAGLGGAHDNLECQTRPLDRTDHPEGTFTDEQWARLEATFPTGVCDPALPPVDRFPTHPWLTYADGPGGMLLHRAPHSRRDCPASSEPSDPYGKGSAPACPGRK